MQTATIKPRLKILQMLENETTKTKSHKDEEIQYWQILTQIKCHLDRDIGKWPTSFPNNMQVSNMQSFDRSKK